jgi:hypothetical protein
MQTITSRSNYFAVVSDDWDNEVRLELEVLSVNYANQTNSVPDVASHLLFNWSFEG